MIRETVLRPLFSTILRDRKLSLAICATAGLQLMLTFSRLPSWPCPFFHSSGLPCPGCGMSRATLLLVQGNWKQAVGLHAFAPIFLIALITITLSVIAPKSYLLRIANKAEQLERHTGLTGLLLICLIVYWLARLVFLQAAFAKLIQG